MDRKMQLKTCPDRDILHDTVVVAEEGCVWGWQKVFGGWDIAAGTFAAILDQIGSCHWFYGAGNHGRHHIQSREGAGIAGAMEPGNLANSMGRFPGRTHRRVLTGYNIAD